MCYSKGQLESGNEPSTKHSFSVTGPYQQAVWCLMHTAGRSDGWSPHLRLHVGGMHDNHDTRAACHVADMGHGMVAANTPPKHLPLTAISSTIAPTPYTRYPDA